MGKVPASPPPLLRRPAPAPYFHSFFNFLDCPLWGSDLCSTNILAPYLFGHLTIASKVKQKTKPITKAETVPFVRDRLQISLLKLSEFKRIS